MNAPTIETERLILSGHTLDDFADSAAMWGDAEVVRFIGGRPFGQDECWARLHRYVGHWATMDFGYWVVREKATGQFMGEVGFMEGMRELEPPFEGAPEIGWALVPRGQGKGYASEAVRAALAWGEAKWGKARTVCMIAPDNTASMRVAQKAGYREYARTAFKGAPVVLLERA
jgi:RimJ/RimL family protein N-acetyltransferase